MRLLELIFCRAERARHHWIPCWDKQTICHLVGTVKYGELKKGRLDDLPCVVPRANFRPSEEGVTSTKAHPIQRITRHLVGASGVSNCTKRLRGSLLDAAAGATFLPFAGRTIVADPSLGCAECVRCGVYQSV